MNDDFIAGPDVTVTTVSGDHEGVFIADTSSGAFSYQSSPLETGVVVVHLEVCNIAVDPKVCAESVLNITIIADTDLDGAIDTKDTDDDGDGVDDDVEMVAPNGGDMNGDGILDSLQRTVSSYPNPIVAGYVSSEVSGSCSNIDDVSYHSEVLLPVQDQPYDYQIGLHGIELSCAAVGGSATITHYWDDECDTTAWEYRKFINSEYIDFSDQVTYGQATVGGETITTVTFTIVDGGPYDSDGVANGQISDPVDPATVVEVLEEVVDEPEQLSETGDAKALLSVLAGAMIGVLATLSGSVRTPQKQKR